MPISRDDGDVADLHMFNAGIWDGQPTLYQAEHVSSVWRTFEILSEASDGHAVASVTGSISDVDIIRSRLDRNTIIPALVDEILQPNVVYVHRVCNPSVALPTNDGEIPSLTEAVCILHPVHTKRCFHSGGVAVDAAQVHVRAIHDIQGPQLRILDVEVLNRNLAYIPEYKWHGSPRLSEILLCVISDVAVTVDATSPVPVDSYPITSNDETGMVILESYRI